MTGDKSGLNPLAMRRYNKDSFEVRRAGPPALTYAPTKVIEALGPLVTESRYARLREVAYRRRTGVMPVLERFRDPHNAAAVMRSAEAFGLQKVHVIPGSDGFHASRTVARGTNDWVDLDFHDTPEECAAVLRGDGYKIYVASMEGSIQPSDLAKEEKVAVVFGHERRGPSPEMRALADGTYAVPMVGFVESLNVSVAAAITLHAATQGRPSIPQSESEVLFARYLMASVYNFEQILEEALGPVEIDGD